MLGPLWGHGATEMPLLAYFWKIGAALLALLFGADFCVPKAPSPRGRPWSGRPYAFTRTENGPSA